LNAASQITNYTGPDGSLTYTYDHAGQLTGVSGAHTESFGYDSNGNRNTTGYTVGTGNQITTDPAGNTLNYLGGNLSTKTDSSGNVWTYTFDFHNRLTQVVEKNSGGTTIFTENLTYDVLGDLISTKVNGTVQRWTVFDGSNPYIDFSGSGSVTRRYVMDPTALDRFFATVASGVPTWLFTDNLGSIREVVSKTGSVLDQITYGAFGNILSQTNSSNAPRYLYAGGEWDANLGLYHFGARWDDPVNGRWISQDPLGLGPDGNSYRYVANSPITYVDPSGLHYIGPGSPYFERRVRDLEEEIRYFEAEIDRLTIFLADPNNTALERFRLQAQIQISLLARLRLIRRLEPYLNQLPGAPIPFQIYPLPRRWPPFSVPVL
jgi:RHS repeat-associated protein